MKKLLYIIIGILLTACTDDVYTTDAANEGAAMRFEATVIDQPQGRGMVLDVNDNTVTRDFKPGDSFGLFIIDGSGNFVSQIDGKNAHNIKLTTPDGKAWNLNSDIKEVVHKLGYKYVAYYPYSETFDDCTSIDGIKKLFTAPAEDQSVQEATDWMYTEETSPQINAVTTLKFYHRYAKIEIYNSFTQEHINDWVDKYKFTKTVDNNNVERYRYILDAATPQTLSIRGTYSIGNELTGMKQFSYNCNDIAIENGRHAIVYTYRMDERCAVDLGLPSGVKWSPINLGTETSTYMDEAAIASLGNVLGKRLAWGELFEKDTYNYASYINDPYLDNSKSLLPTDIAETVYDPVKQYWGGHWMLPSVADMQEFIDNTEIVSTETVTGDELGKEINKITFRSKINGKEITMLTNGYATNASVSGNLYLYYMSANLSSYAYCVVMNNNPSMKTASFNRYYGMCIRPVLKERNIYTYSQKKEIIVRHIDDLAVDLGIIKEVTNDNGEVIKYKLLWSPFNYGVEKKTDLQTYNGASINEDTFLSNCKSQPGMRLAWGDIEERPETEKFDTDGYKSSAIAQKYAWYTDDNTNLDKRDLLLEDDIVQLNWPDGWYIPTARDYELLAKNTTVTTEKINGRDWFKLTSNNGNSILIPPTGYIDDAYNTERWASDAYLQSSSIGYSSTKPAKPICYALKLSGTTATLAPTAGRPTGLMVRPVKYVRVN